MIVETITAECSQYLAAFDHTRPLLRGLEGMKADHLLMMPTDRSKRSGAELGVEQHTDAYLKKNKFKAMRLQSAFCTHEATYAEQYGDLFYFFPKDGYSFAYGAGRDLIPTVEKWLIEDANYEARQMGLGPGVQDMLHDARSDIWTFGVYLDRAPKMRKLYHAYLDRYGLSQTDLRAGLDANAEFWFTGEYHVVRKESQMGWEVWKAFGLF
jgi:hypothetical protein